MNTKLLPLVTAYAYDYTDTTINGITPFLKSVFLVQHHANGPQKYDFTSSDYGPFNHRLYDDIEQLVEHGFIDTTQREKTGPFGVTFTYTEYSISEKGIAAVETGTKQHDTFEYNLLEVVSVVTENATDDTYELLTRVRMSAPDLFTGRYLFLPQKPTHA